MLLLGFASGAPEPLTGGPMTGHDDDVQANPRITRSRMVAMRLRCLGVGSQNGTCPTLFASDRETYVVQGWRTGPDDSVIEIPHMLLGFLESGTCLGTSLTDTGRGTFTLRGTPVTDHEALQQMNLPDHETSIEIAKGKEVRPA